MRVAGLALGRKSIAQLTDLTSMDAAELYRQVAVCLGGFELTDAWDMASRSVEIYERFPQSKGLALALEHRSHFLRAVGRYEEARAAVARAVEVGEVLQNRSLLRRSMVHLAWYDLTRGQRDQAVARARAAIQLVPVAPDPVAEIIIGVEHTDILLVTCASVEDVEAAARPGLEFGDWEIAPHLISILRCNVAQSLTNGGHIQRSAALLDPVTMDAVSRAMAGRSISSGLASTSCAVAWSTHVFASQTSLPSPAHRTTTWCSQSGSCTADLALGRQAPVRARARAPGVELPRP